MQKQFLEGIDIAAPLISMNIYLCMLVLIYAHFCSILPMATLQYAPAVSPFCACLAMARGLILLLLSLCVALQCEAAKSLPSLKQDTTCLTQESQFLEHALYNMLGYARAIGTNEYPELTNDNYFCTVYNIYIAVLAIITNVSWICFVRKKFSMFV